MKTCHVGGVTHLQNQQWISFNYWYFHETKLLWGLILSQFIAPLNISWHEEHQWAEERLLWTEEENNKNSSCLRRLSFTCRILVMCTLPTYFSATKILKKIFWLTATANCVTVNWLQKGVFANFRLETSLNFIMKTGWWRLLFIYASDCRTKWLSFPPHVNKLPLSFTPLFVSLTNANILNIRLLTNYKCYTSDSLTTRYSSEFSYWMTIRPETGNGKLLAKTITPSRSPNTSIHVSCE